MFTKLFKEELVSGSAYQIIGKKNQKCLDVEGGKNTPSTPLILHQQNNGKNQAFVFTNKGNDEWELTPQHATNMALDIQGNSSEDNATLQLYYKNNTNAQRFKLSKNIDGSFKILTKSSNFAKAISVVDNSANDSSRIIQLSTTAESADWNIVVITV